MPRGLRATPSAWCSYSPPPVPCSSRLPWFAPVSFRKFGSRPPRARVSSNNGCGTAQALPAFRFLQQVHDVGVLGAHVGHGADDLLDLERAGVAIDLARLHHE